MSDPELKMTIKTLARRGVPNRQIARQLDLTEGAVRYHLKRIEAGATDGRARQRRLAAEVADAIAHWYDTVAAPNTAELHAWLVAEHNYSGSLRSVQRFVAEHYPQPARRTRRRVETPPGAQAQVDWGHFPGVIVGGRPVELSAFAMILSHSRMAAIRWADSQNLASWLGCHNRAFEALGGIPAVVRVDNCKTAVVRGAGPWGTLNEGYRRYALTVRFHVDPCLPREPRAKGKVERGIRTLRGTIDPTSRAWESVAELQAERDRRMAASAERHRCPATGTSVAKAFTAERPFLAPLPLLPEPFDTLATRTVGVDCMVAFEARQYSVPFRLVGERVEIRGIHRRVQILHGARVVAEHPRGTDSRVVIDRAHYEGEATATHVPPMPLGRLGTVLERLGELPVEHRPADLYGAIAEELSR